MKSNTIRILILIILCLFVVLYFRNRKERYTPNVEDLPYKDLDNEIPKTTQLDSIKDLKFNTYFINLLDSTERKKNTIQEFEKIGIEAKRLDAIKYKPGSIGCSLSHIKALETAKAANLDYVLICEDDITFLQKPEEIIRQLNTFLQKYKDWDVILLSTDVLYGEYIGDGCIQVKYGLQTTGYIVRKEYYNVLLQNFRVGVERLHRSGTDRHAIDVHWFSLQQRDKWYLPYPLLARQRDGQSDINDSYANKGGVLDHVRTNTKNLPKDL